MKATQLSEEFGFQEIQNHYAGSAYPLFLIQPDKTLQVITADDDIEPEPEQIVIALVDESEEEKAPSAQTV